MKFKGDPLVTLGLGVVGATAIAASSSTLVGLADYVGWHGKIAWALPACIDMLALAAGRVWLNEDATGEARAYARRVSMVAIAISILGNAIGHIVGMDNVSPVKVVLAIIVGSIPPAALAAVGHLYTMATMRQAAPVVEEETLQDLVAEPAPVEPEPVVETSKPTRRPGQKETLARAAWDEARDAGRMPSGAELARAAEADPTMGSTWKRRWAEEEAQKTTNRTGASFALVTA